jgi:hypothetical protein
VTKPRNAIPQNTTCRLSASPVRST